jgi:hypothetical protein
MNRIASIGECMLELSAAQVQPTCGVFGGDTLNIRSISRLTCRSITSRRSATIRMSA